MAGRFHHQWRFVKPGRRFCLLAWAVGTMAIAATVLLGQENADPVPPVRLLYGTRRMQIDVPRRPLQSVVRPVEPWPIPRRPILPSDSPLPSDPPLPSVPPRFSRPPSTPIDAGERPPVDEPLVRSRLGAWQPVLPQEGPPDGDISPPEDGDAESGPAADNANPPAGDDEVALPDDAGPQDAAAPETSASPLPADSSSATAGGSGSLSDAAEGTPRPRQRLERLDQGNSNQPPRNEGWLIATLFPALGTILGVMLGILFSTLLTLLLLKRFPGQFDRVVRVELINGFPSAPQWGPGHSQPPANDARFPQPDGPDFAAAEFGELILPLEAAGPTAEYERQAALREQQLAEEAVLKSIYEDNVELRECLAAKSRTA